MISDHLSQVQPAALKNKIKLCSTKSKVKKKKVRRYYNELFLFFETNDHIESPLIKTIIIIALYIVK